MGIMYNIKIQKNGVNESFLENIYLLLIYFKMVLILKTHLKYYLLSINVLVY